MATKKKPTAGRPRIKKGKPFSFTKLDAAEKRIRRDHKAALKNKRVRPTAMILLFRQTEKFALPEAYETLLVQSKPRKKGDAIYWGPSKGGIDRGETPLFAGMRELREEVGLGPESISVVGYLGTRDVEGSSSKGPRTKRLFIFVAIYRGNDETIRFNPDELCGAALMSQTEADTRIGEMKKTRPHRVATYREAIPFAAKVLAEMFSRPTLP